MSTGITVDMNSATQENRIETTKALIGAQLVAMRKGLEDMAQWCHDNQALALRSPQILAMYDEKVEAMRESIRISDELRGYLQTLDQMS
jgi:hypothetical protein